MVYAILLYLHQHDSTLDPAKWASEFLYACETKMIPPELRGQYDKIGTVFRPGFSRGVYSLYCLVHRAVPFRLSGVNNSDQASTGSIYPVEEIIYYYRILSSLEGPGSDGDYPFPEQALYV